MQHAGRVAIIENKVCCIESMWTLWVLCQTIWILRSVDSGFHTDLSTSQIQMKKTFSSIYGGSTDPGNWTLDLV